MQICLRWAISANILCLIAIFTTILIFKDNDKISQTQDTKLVFNHFFSGNLAKFFYKYNSTNMNLYHNIGLGAVDCH